MTHAEALRVSLDALNFYVREIDRLGAFQLSDHPSQAEVILREMLEAEEEWERDNACGEELNPEETP